MNYAVFTRLEGKLARWEVPADNHGEAAQRLRDEGVATPIFVLIPTIEQGT